MSQIDEGINWMGRPQNPKLIPFAVACLVIVAVSAGLFLYLSAGRRVPPERALIEKFQTHKVAYERLRDMLLADKQILRVADWGIETTDSGNMRASLMGDFPVARYREYVGLLQETGSVGVFRGRGERPDSVGIILWASGFGGDTRHVDLCWLDHEPPNQVQSLDQLHRPRRPVFRHIEDHWYLWAD